MPAAWSPGRFPVKRETPFDFCHEAEPAWAQLLLIPAGDDFPFPRPKAMKEKATPFLKILPRRRTQARIEKPHSQEQRLPRVGSEREAVPSSPPSATVRERPRT